MRTRKLKLQYTEQLDSLNAATASVWRECLILKEMWDYSHGYRTGGALDMPCELWMDKQLSKSQPLHSQSIQEVRRRYFKNRKGFREKRKNGDKKAKPPHRDKKFQTTTWKKSAIHFKGSMLVLSNGQGNAPLKVQLPKNFDLKYAISHIAIVELVYDKGQYTLHFVYNVGKSVKSKAKGVVGVDIGEIHPMVSHDGVNTRIFNGRYIRSLYRLRNKVIASFNKKIDRCKRHSKRWWYLVRHKWKRIRQIDNQIRDGLHKHTTKFLQMCKDRDIATIVIGDLTGIRENIDYGKKANQKLHQWAFGKITQLISYKAKSLGIKVEVIDESYTSQTCPKCGNRKKPTKREYKCKCGFIYHRDGVGAINIRQKYLGHLGAPVAATMASPVGIRLECRRCSA
ncbi:IS200/IS605 family element transposase accessory protein TnpB [Candidatus Poribacteria bacterium]|nr:IS200/IS605 family element transposase accessory protein TnpB [Candidatus Poribacteria bacterium]MYK24741.1 IS200/IS605 family element transposase accessory protein TnpB [Candidatus Poribacteria bacterium]